MTDPAKQIEKMTDELASQALADLARLVNVNSFSNNSHGLIRAGELIQAIARDKGICLEKVCFKDRPDGPFHLVCDFADNRPFTGLIGHFDTVHPPESVFNTLQDKGETLTGPGVQDMKSGIIAAIYGLYIAGKVMNTDRLPVKIVFNGDEEIGSPDSRGLIETTMAGAASALIFEGRKRSTSALVTSRKGIMMGEMEIKGKAAHAGEEPEQGASAILEAAYKIKELDRLKDPENGLILTTGRIEGGEVANQIPDFCRSTIDVRFTTKAQEERVKHDIQTIMDQVHVKGCTTTYTLETARPPFEKTEETQALFEAYAGAAEAFGVSLSQSHRGGGSDGNFTAALGIPTLDGVGAAGDFPHTDSEYIDKASFIDAIKIAALLFTTLLNP